MSHIEVYVLKSFPWSEDGYTQQHVEVHKTIAIPDGLFDGLNKEGYVRRSVIGDGHVSLQPSSTGESGPEALIPLPDGVKIEIPAPAAPVAAEPPAADSVATSQISPDATAPVPPTAEPPLAPVVAAGGTVAAPAAPTVVGEKVSEATIPVAAPQPASKTAALSAEEEQALADGTWKDLRFFAQRSIAAKLSAEPVSTGDDVKRVIEAELAKRAVPAAKPAAKPAELL